MQNEKEKLEAFKIVWESVKFSILDKFEDVCEGSERLCEPVPHHYVNGH